MRSAARGLWRILSFPFSLIFQVVAFPFRAVARFNRFLNAEPEEHALADILTGVVTDRAVREFIWAEVDSLRAHLLRAVVGLALGVGLSFYFTQQIIEYLAIPIGGLGELKAIEVTESVGVFMRVALLSGITVALPYIAFEFWLFAARGGLKPREKKFGLVAIPLATLFFVAGLGFAFYMLLPTALPFLLNFMGIQAELRPLSYFGFVTGLMFWLGVFFEFPLVVYVLTALGLIKPTVLAQQWRLAILLIAILAAAITPTIDPINMSLVMVPMSVLYFISIGLSYLAYAGRRPAGSGGEGI